MTSDQHPATANQTGANQTGARRAPGRSGTTEEIVHTYADAFGTWHARVTIPGGAGPRWMDANMSRIRAKARRAIRREVTARGDLAGPGWACRTTLVRTDLDHMNLIRSMTYREADR